MIVYDYMYPVSEYMVNIPRKGVLRIQWSSDHQVSDSGSRFIGTPTRQLLVVPFKRSSSLLLSVMSPFPSIAVFTLIAKMAASGV